MKDTPIVEVVDPDLLTGSCAACHSASTRKVVVGYEYLEGLGGGQTNSIALCTEHAESLGRKLLGKQCAMCGPVPVCERCKQEDAGGCDGMG